MKAYQLRHIKEKIARAMYDNSYSRIKRWEEVGSKKSFRNLMLGVAKLI